MAQRTDVVGSNVARDDGRGDYLVVARGNSGGTNYGVLMKIDGHDLLELWTYDCAYDDQLCAVAAAPGNSFIAVGESDKEVSPYDADVWPIKLGY